MNSVDLIGRQIAHFPYARHNTKGYRKPLPRSRFFIIAYHRPAPCMVCSDQRILLSSGKYKYIENIRPQDTIIDARGKKRYVTSIKSTRDYMGRLFLTTKKSRNPVGIPRRNKILIQTDAHTHGPKQNLIDRVFDVQNVSLGVSKEYVYDAHSIWVPSQNVVENTNFVSNVKIDIKDIVLPLEMGHSFSFSFSYSHGFIIGAFLTCGCRRSNEEKQWTQFILDTKDTYFQKLLLLCLYNIHLSTSQTSESIWSVKTIEHSDVNKVDVSSDYLYSLLSSIEEGQRELPNSYTCGVGYDCLLGMYESILHTNHYFSNAHVYDLFMFLESLLGKTDYHVARGEVLTIAKHDRYPSHDDIIHVLYTDTDEPFSSTICDHIPMASM